MADVAHFAGAPSQGLKGHGLYAWSGHMPRLQVHSWSGCEQEATDQYSLSLSIPSFLSKINIHIHMSSGEDKEIK